LEKVRILMDRNVPDALVNGYESLIDGMALPDENDRHVLAAAIKGNAEGIITFNLKDFPEDALSQYGVSAIHPDEFLSDMFELDPAKCLQAAQQQRRSLRNPPFSSEEYLSCLLKQKLPSFVKHLKTMAFAL